MNQFQKRLVSELNLEYNNSIVYVSFTRVNFINILGAAFTHEEPKSAKKTVK